MTHCHFFTASQSDHYSFFVTKTVSILTETFLDWGSQKTTMHQRKLNVLSGFICDWKLVNSTVKHLYFACIKFSRYDLNREIKYMRISGICPRP